MEKVEILKETLLFLKDNRETQIAALKGNIENIFKQQGAIGEKTERHGMMTSTSYVRLSSKDALAINQVIYDLLYKERVITPGVNANNLDLPFLHVSDLERLEELLQQY